MVAEQLHNLESLNLCETPVTDDGLSSLVIMSSLRNLNLNSTRLSPTTYEKLKVSGLFMAVRVLFRFTATRGCDWLEKAHGIFSTNQNEEFFNQSANETNRYAHPLGRPLYTLHGFVI